MPKKRDEDALTISKVKELLKYKKSFQISANDLLKEAYNKNLITEKQYIVSLPKKFSVLKSYLYTYIKNEFHRSQIEKYVKLYSKFYIRGTYIANLLCKSKFVSYKKIERINLNILSNNATQLYNLIENKNVFKQIFLPERWPTKEIELHDWIGNTRDTHQNILSHLYDENYKNLMPVTGWDNALNSMYIKYRANIENHVKVHLLDNVKKYIQKVCECEDKKLLINLFERKPRPLCISNNDYEHIVELREYIGINKYNCINKFINYNEKNFQLHIKLIRSNSINSTFLPLATLTRKYAYIDTKLGQFLFREKSIKDTQDKHITEILGLTFENIKKIKKEKRKSIRKKKKNYKNGMGVSIPKYSSIISIETDGIGLSIKLESAIKEVININNEIKEEDKLENPIFVGIDTGRAKIFTASIMTNSSTREIQNVVYTRHKYYYEIKHRIRKNLILQKMREDIELQNIHNDLSLDNGKRNIQTYITKQHNYSNKLLNEYLESKEYALWRMRLFRLTVKSRDNSVREIIRKANNRPIIIGMGDAGFSSNSKGEKSVPTSGILKAFYKQKFIYHQPIKIIPIDEFKTSKICCDCFTETVHKSAPGRQLRNIFCKECLTRHPKQIIDFTQSYEFNYTCQCNNIIKIKRFTKSIRLKQCNSVVCHGKCHDRDIMASKNMLTCLYDEYIGNARLNCFCR